MNANQFSCEIENMHDASISIVGKIKAHNLPVVIFGAGAYAKVMASTLKKFGVKILGFAVDSKYYSSLNANAINNIVGGGGY